ncbi:MAG: MATE family efflux transporter [Victivallaceae bacterium]|nr:MATE family efflux transporter [Victivallaceae bacterium]
MRAKEGCYTRGSIMGTLFRSSISMLPGTLAITGYNLADTLFVAKLGTIPLAAMGYTFPVIVLVNCFYRGVGVGVTASTAHAIGGRKHKKAAKLVTAGVVLVALFSVLVACVGVNTIDATFRLFNADPAALPMIFDYMSIWYYGSITIALCMTGNDLLITVGDTKMASAVMFGGMILNVFLNWIFIFKLGLGIRGAAWATIVSQCSAAVATMLRLWLKHDLFDSCAIGLARLLRVWRVILRITLPSIPGMMMMPLGVGATTYVTNFFGAGVVAGATAAMRMEGIAFIFPMSFGMTLMPLVGQNFGARLYKRIDECRHTANHIVFFFGLAMAVLFFFGAPYITCWFTDDPAVAAVMVLYLRIIPWGFGLVEIHRYSTFFYTGCNRPNIASLLNFLRIGVLLVPFLLLALWIGRVELLFGARLAADVIAGTVGWVMMTMLTRRLAAGQSSAPVREK